MTNRQSISDRATLLRQATEKARSAPLHLTIRELIGYWDAYRRGYWVVDRIERDLAEAGLRTEPHFAEGWIDTEVALVLAAEDPVEHALEVSQTVDEALPAAGLKVGSLASAHREVVGVQRNADLQLAQTLMMSHDFSQLSVMAGQRDLVGALSWESIALARLRKADAELKDAIIPAVVVNHDEDLIPLISRVADVGFVFVRGADKTISGVVTTADLSIQFADLAGPFLIIGEIERRLRRAIARAFGPDELQDMVDPADRRPVAAADDLSLGEIVRLIEVPDRWSRLGWPLDRAEFVKALTVVKETRNDVMHFSPDPLDREEVARLHRFVKWLRTIDPAP